jgi:drug/metabolite transporter (DMT)-like permease
MTWLLLTLVVMATVASDLLQSAEMKRAGRQSVDARGLARLLKMIVVRPYLTLSIGCLAVSFFAFMALVQHAPLSFAVPASAASLILETALAKFLLHEAVGPRRIAGSLLVLGGVVLLAR